MTFDTLSEINGRITGLENIVAGRAERKSIAEQILQSEQFAQFRESKSDSISIELKTAITSTGLQNDPLVGSAKPFIDAGVRRRLNIRDLIPSYPTTNGAIELPRKSAQTNNAGPQRAGSPLLRENVTKPESAFTFESSYVPVATFAHFVPVSAQIFEDQGQLNGFIQGELAHGLQVAIEHSILNGDSTVGTLDGLVAAAAAYTTRSPLVSGKTKIIRDALRQCAAADYTPSAIILHPTDWRLIDDALSGDGAVRTMDAPRLWGLPVVESNAITAGTFLCGDFANAAALFVRQASRVLISRFDNMNFQKNMVTIRAEERLALVPTNAGAGALIKGSL